MEAKDYPVTFPYGATTKPYSPTRPHLGEDRKMPKGTPININGVLVGYAGTTGFSTGDHTHNQRVYGNTVVHPQGGGFEVPQPCYVTETGYKQDSIGYYVRYRDGNGFVWSIFHMDKPASVRVGQQLIKESKMQLTPRQVDIAFKMSLLRDPTEAELNNVDYQKSAGLLIDTLWNNGGKKRYDERNQTYKEVGTIDGQKIYKKG